MENIVATDQLEKTAETGSISWRLPPRDMVLGSDQVHVWRASIDLDSSSVQNFWQTLTMGEQARAERFYFPKDRRHFIVARGLLRAILGRYLNREPSRLRFVYNEYGKPALAKDHGEDALSFSLSHSGGLALYAVTRRREIGIDLERVRVKLSAEPIAERFLSPGEVAELRALPASMQKEGFFNCWTRKEAYMKAKGKGLWLALDQFEVSLVPGEPAALLSTNGDRREACRWSLQDLTPAPGFVAALAVAGHNWQMKCYQWPE
jgi:4'-phosphopantetheinyl transferase